MTREEKINLLNKLLEIEEKLDIGNLTRAEKGEFRQWVEALEQEPTTKEEAYNKGYEDGVKSVNICPHCGEYIGEEE